MYQAMKDSSMKAKKRLPYDVEQQMREDKKKATKFRNARKGKRDQFQDKDD